MTNNYQIIENIIVTIFGRDCDRIKLSINYDVKIVEEYVYNYIFFIFYQIKTLLNAIKGLFTMKICKKVKKNLLINNLWIQ